MALVTIKVTSGPSKADMIFSLFDGKKVVFTNDKNDEYTLVLRSVEAEDGSLESWNIKAQVILVNRQSPAFAWNKGLSGYYNSKRRNGQLELK